MMTNCFIGFLRSKRKRNCLWNFLLVPFHIPKSAEILFITMQTVTHFKYKNMSVILKS